MIYPPFLQPGNLIGVTAPSAGCGDDEDALDLSLSNIRQAGFAVKETTNVRAAGVVSGTAADRAAQFRSLVRDRDVRMIWCAAGGDLLTDMLSKTDFEEIAQNPKWIQGYSDPTSLLYAVTTLCDMATVYGTNAGGFDVDSLADWQKDNFSLLCGEPICQKSFDAYQRETWCGGDDTVRPVFWETPHGNVDAQGRLLGGCMDCLRNMIGTRFDGTDAFIRRYYRDGLIWYFDVFAMKAEEVYLTLWQMKERGWFEYARGILLGRVCFAGSTIGMTYAEAFKKALPDIPLVTEADVGHIPPRMTLVNGAMARLTAANGKGSLSMRYV